jgi:hypothetical protein
MLELITGGVGGADICCAREKLRCRLLVPAQIQVPITEVLNGTRSRFLRESLFYVRSYSFAQIALEGNGKMRAQQKKSEREREALRREGSLGRSDGGRDKPAALACSDFLWVVGIFTAPLNLHFILYPRKKASNKQSEKEFSPALLVHRLRS